MFYADSYVRVWGLLDPPQSKQDTVLLTKVCSFSRRIAPLKFVRDVLQVLTTPTRACVKFKHFINVFMKFQVALFISTVFSPSLLIFSLRFNLMNLL